MPDGDLHALLARFPAQRILVVGDVMLDEYVWGTVRRISPEAPVPVVELEKRSHVPGGAANAAANVAGLGAQVSVLSVIGRDESGKRLLAALARNGIGSQGILGAEGRPTTTKMRILAQSQQIVRVDHEDHSPLPVVLEERLLHLIDEYLPQVDGCILSDYAKGLVTPGVARRLIQQAVSMGKPVIVDPKKSDPVPYRGATLVKPNLNEASLLLRREVSSPADVLEAGRHLLDLLEAQAVLLTRGAAGMTLFQHGVAPVHVPAQAREVFDVTGAGDTVAATLAVALAVGATSEQAAHLASRAAAVTVSRLGTCAIRLDDLRSQDR